MVGGGEVGGVAAVVGGDHHQIVRPHLLHERRKPAVELRQRGGVAVDVPPVAVEHVEVHQVDEAQAGEVLVGVGQGLGHAVGVALGVDVFRRPLSREDVVDLAHGDGVEARVLEGVEHRLLRRLQREVVAVGGAGVVAAAADEGTGDDAAHAVLAAQDLPGNAAVFVELLHGDHVLMGGDLEHGVGGGVDDQIPGPHVLVAVFVDDGCAGPGRVGQHAAAGSFAEGRENLLREAVRVGGQRIGGDHARDLPVADGGVLAHGGLGQLAVSAAGL